VYGVPHGIAAGGELLEFRGASVHAPHFARVLAVAQRAGWKDVRVRTHGGGYTTPALASRLADGGVRGAAVPLFSHVTGVHDRIAGRVGALEATLRALGALSGAGLSVSLEVPLLSSRLQDLGLLLERAHRAAPSLGAMRVYVPVAPPPPVLAPPPWDQVREGLGRLLTVAERLGVRVQVHEFDAIPLCVLGHDETHQRVYQFDPRRPVARRSGFGLLEPCAGCAVRAHCAGPSDAAREAHGGQGLRPFARRPARLFEQRTTPRREWTETHRRAASRVINRVLRPTIHCNQDCVFCSANETTENVFKDSSEMLRGIARMARAGVRQVSFSGGEPTLSKDLVHYVRAASRLGIEDIELVTNGVLIDGPEKVRPLVEAGLNKAFVSLHGHDELLSRRATAKVGDWERSVRAIDALVEAGVRVDVNHVITAVNYPYLPRFADFVCDRWGGRVGISFAFVTPQFKALENGSLLPRISEVMPYLHRAMTQLEARGNPFTVGSRQGIPPCFLGEFTGWSDFIEKAPQALADDEPQKARGPQCERCRFSPQCVGLWRPYAMRYGFDELVPVPGPPLTRDEVALITAKTLPIRHFDRVHPTLRRILPRAALSEASLAIPPLPPEPRRLPVLGEEARTVRLALLGSGPHAQRLLRAARQVPGLAVKGVASPHLLDRDPGPFAGLVLERDPEALLETLRPDAVIVAAATVAHLPLAQLALARGLPVLLEKPLTRTQDEARVLLAQPRADRVMAAHVLLFAPGVRALRERLAEGAWVPRHTVCARRTPPSAPDAPRGWSRDALYQPLYHAAYLLLAFGAGEPALTRVEARGRDRPLWVRAEVCFPSGATGEIVLDSESPAPLDELIVRGPPGRQLIWRREGPAETLAHDSPQGERITSVERGSDVEGMLAAFRAAVLGHRPVPAGVHDGLLAMRLAQAIVDALADRIARPDAPRHVASPALRER